MNDLQIISCSTKDVKQIVNAINAYNLEKVPPSSDLWTPFDFAIHNNENVLIGGIIAGMGYWNGLEIKFLWVDTPYRKKGIGSYLLNHVESLASKENATISTLDTFDFQGLGFYTKNGYSVFGEIDNFPIGHKRYYLKKELI